MYEKFVLDVHLYDLNAVYVNINVKLVCIYSSKQKTIKLISAVTVLHAMTSTSAKARTCARVTVSTRPAHTPAHAQLVTFLSVLTAVPISTSATTRHATPTPAATTSTVALSALATLATGNRELPYSFLTNILAVTVPLALTTTSATRARAA